MNTTSLQRRALASSILNGQLPSAGLHPDDFDVEHRPMVAAINAVVAAGKPVTTVNVWQWDRKLDPVALCEMVSDFATDEAAHAFLADAYTTELRLRAEHLRRGRAA